MLWFLATIGGLAFRWVALARSVDLWLGMNMLAASLTRVVESVHARRSVRALALTPLLVASVAHAQAPGEVVPVAPTPQVVPVTPGTPIVLMVQPAMPGAPVEPGAVEQPREPIMANRWALGLSFGAVSLAPPNQSKTTDFAVGELALRFRATPHLELELSAGGGRQQINGKDADLEYDAGTLAARWRFNPEGSWNWYAMAGFGGASITSHDATSKQRDAATQPLGALGLGLEWRVRHFALQAEARAVVLDKQTVNDAMPDTTATAAMSSTMTSAPPSTTSSLQKQTGAELTVGLNWYF